MAHVSEDPNDPDPDDTPLTAQQIRAKLAVSGEGGGGETGGRAGG